VSPVAAGTGLVRVKHTVDIYQDQRGKLLHVSTVRGRPATGQTMPGFGVLAPGRPGTWPWPFMSQTRENMRTAFPDELHDDAPATRRRPGSRRTASGYPPRSARATFSRLVSREYSSGSRLQSVRSRQI
jgi:hypothetical protein